MASTIGGTLFSLLGLVAKFPPPPGPFPVACFRFRVPTDGGVLTQVFFPAKESSNGYKKASRNRRRAYRPGFIAGTAEASGTPLALWKLFLTKVKSVVPDFVPLEDDIAGDGAHPVLFFSHGLKGSSDSYTKTCADLASHGFIVVAMEHEDESGCYACTADGRVLHYKFPPPPPLPRSVVQEFRAPFLEKRQQEVMKVVEFFTSSPPESAGDAAGVLKRIDRSRLVLGGHSFGAATTVQVLRQMGDKFTCALLLDIWSFPIPLEQGLNGVPICLIESDEFVRNDEAYITAEFVKNSDQIWCSVYIDGSRHLSMGDATFWLPNSMSKRFGLSGKTSRSVVQKALIDTSVAFLKRRVLEGAQEAGDLEDAALKMNPAHLKQFREMVGEGVTNVRS